jgi:hypothetical protein
MAIVLEANYSKKLGLPGYSSHQFSVTLRTEVADLSQVEAESARLHTLLQSSVDKQIEKVGYLPQNGNSNRNGRGNGNGNGHPNGNSRFTQPQNGGGGANGSPDAWSCSPKQKQYILDLVEQHQLDKAKVEALAQERFGKSVRALNKLEASGLIEELKEKEGSNGRQNGRPNQPSPAAGAR